MTTTVSTTKATTTKLTTTAKLKTTTTTTVQTTTKLTTGLIETSFHHFFMRSFRITVIFMEFGSEAPPFYAVTYCRLQINHEKVALKTTTASQQPLNFNDLENLANQFNDQEETV